jgi:large subunit ribosomal protein L25
MAERVSIDGEQRSRTGKKASQLRSEGWIPGVIYGQGDNLVIQVEDGMLTRALREAGTTNLIDITIGKDERTVLAKDVQRHVTRGDLIHVDFYEVNMSETIIVEAALVTIGEAAPVTDGLGTTSQVMYTLEIECLPDKLLSEIVVDLSLIESPEQMIHVRDLSVPPGVDVLADPDTVVARFEYLQAEIEEEEEEEELLFAQEADEVEVISKGKQDEDGEEQGSDE